MHYLIIANEFSGTDKGHKVLLEVENYLKDKSIEFTTWKTQYATHATELARNAISQNHKDIIVVGGDGTFNEVINGIDLNNCKDIRLGLVPSGSGNDFVRNTNIKGSTNQILDYILNSEPSLVDCCTVNGAPFMNICGFGLDVDLIVRQAKIKKIFKGKISYYVALLVTLFNIKFKEVTYAIDDNEPIKSKILLIAVANGSTYGGGLPVTPIAKIQDGILDVCVINKMSRFKIPYLLFKFLKGTHIKEKKYVNYYKCKKVCVECDSDSPLNIDGELLLHTPCVFEIIPKCVNIYI